MRAQTSRFTSMQVGQMCVKTVRFRCSTFKRLRFSQNYENKSIKITSFVAVTYDLLTPEQFSCQFGCGGAYPWVPLKFQLLEFYLSKPVPNVSIKSSGQTAILRGKVSESLVVWCCPVVWCWRTGERARDRSSSSTVSVQRCYMKHTPSLSMSAQSRPSPNTTSPPLKSQTLHGHLLFSARFICFVCFSFFFFFLLALLCVWERSCVLSIDGHCPFTVIMI